MARISTYLSVVFYCFSSCFLFAKSNSQIDSLLLVLQTAKEDTGKVNTMNQLAWQFRIKSDYQQALLYGDSALVLAGKLNFKKGIGNAYNNIGAIYNDRGNFSEALKNYIASLNIWLELGSKGNIAASYNNIGLIYGQQGNQTEAMKNHKACLKIMSEIGNKRGMAGSYINIGTTYEAEGNYAEALKNYEAALKLMEEVKNKLGMAGVYVNIGRIYDLQGNDAVALKNYLTSLGLMEEIGNKKGIAECCNNIGTVYTKLKKNNEASQYLNKGLSLAKEIGSIKDMRQSYAGLARLDSSQGNFKLALEHYKLYVTYRDSLHNSEKERQAVQALMQFEFDRKNALAKAEQEHKDELSRAEIHKHILFKNYLLVIISLIIFSGVILFSRFRLKKKLERQQAINEERRRISSDMHDDLGSNLSKISLVSEVLKQHTFDAREKEELGKISSTAQDALDKMSEIVWALNPKNDKLANLLAYIRKYAVEYFESTSIECKINIPAEIVDVEISGEQRRNIFLTIKESLHNVLKHSGATEVEITFIDDKGEWQLIIHDNGKGIDNASLGKRKDGTPGNGLESMKQRMEQVNGKLKIENRNGTWICLEIIPA